MKDFKKYYIINATPDLVFLALTNPTIIKLWSGDDAIMSAEPNTEFSLWQGNICGLNLEFIENKKIVQEWFFGEQVEKSIVTILLHEHQKGTSVELRHNNIPDADYDDIIEGWNSEYFEAIQEFYEEG
ncbi:MAG: SRPBCC domain-containing protein [Bacteroidetes bacterium]|nr:SRPBCC domain-containing protein [Bacteroidota bacterium]